MVNPILEIAQRTLSYDPGTGAFARVLNHRGTPCAPTPTGKKIQIGYTQVVLAKKRYYAHRLAFLLMTGDWPRGEVDHINGDRSDNRWANLRDVSKLTNIQNRHHPKANCTGLPGVKLNNGRFQARITAHKVTVHLGTFETAELAHAAYQRARTDYHPGYAA